MRLNVREIRNLRLGGELVPQPRVRKSVEGGIHKIRRSPVRKVRKTLREFQTRGVERFASFRDPDLAEDDSLGGPFGPERRTLGGPAVDVEALGRSLGSLERLGGLEVAGGALARELGE